MTDVSKLVSFTAMTSPYLQKRLRSIVEAVEDKLHQELRHQYKANDMANRRARIVQTGNVFRFGPRVVSKFGGRR
jgi:LPS O-antigen subunit length determinant protein (WzzB/FepE family)